QPHCIHRSLEAPHYPCPAGRRTAIRFSSHRWLPLLLLLPAGTVLIVHVSPGQYVPLAAPLVTVADLSQLWVRVPVPEQELPHVARGLPASLRPRFARTDRRKPAAGGPKPDLDDDD